MFLRSVPGRFLILTLAFAVAAAVLYGQQFSLWSVQLMGSGEDGIKNFYTVLYHITHDPGFLWFRGMNHPYGEHVLYTDNQPLVANALKMLDGIFPIAEHLSLLLPGLIFLSYLWGAWCIHSLATKAGAPLWFSIPASVGVMLLSPQLVRLGGHYSLAYGAVIPFYFLLLFHALEKQGFWSWSRLLGWSFLTAFIHPYFLVMLALTTGCVLLIEAWRHQSLFKARAWLRIFVLTLLPVLLFQAVMWLTDPVGDRSADPYGFLVYRATWASVFLPLDLSYFHALAHWGEQSAEGGFYLGLFAMLGAAAGILAGSKKATTTDVSGARQYAKTILLASVPLLLLAAGFPFYIWKFHHLLEYLGPLKQFRGIARFAFVFFYAANIFAIVYLGNWLKAGNPGVLKPLAALLLLALLWFEVVAYSSKVRSVSSSGSSVFHHNPWQNLPAAGFSSFEAILPLPYFHIGSENFRTPEHAGIREQSFALSQQTGLPLLAVQMSRTSLSQTLHSLELCTELLDVPYYIEQGLFEKEHLLVLVDADETLNAVGQKLVDAAQPIGSYGRMQLYDLDMKDFEAIAENNKQETKVRQQQAFVIGDDPLLQQATGHYFQGFDDRPAERTFYGTGSLEIDRIDWTDLVPETYPFSDSVHYELSFWFYAGDQHAVNTQLWLWERRGEEAIRFEVAEVGDRLVAVKGQWILVSLLLEPQQAGNHFQVMLHRDGKRQKIWVDEVLLRPSNTDFCRPNPINLNNRYYTYDGLSTKPGVN